MLCTALKKSPLPTCVFIVFSYSSVTEHYGHFEITLYLIISFIVFLQNTLKIQVCFENSNEIILNEVIKCLLKRTDWISDFLL